MVVVNHQRISLYSYHNKMALAPVTGMLRRRLTIDLATAFGLGTAMGYLFWHGYHVPAVRHRDAFYEQLAQKQEEEDA